METSRGCGPLTCVAHQRGHVRDDQTNDDRLEGQAGEGP